MAKYRAIQTTFWSDSKVIDDFTPEDRYFYLYLLTNEKSNQLGCYELSIKQICRDTGYNEETVKRLLDRFENELQVINYDFKTKEIFLKNWHKYNWLESENTKKCVEKEFNLIKSSVLKEFISPLYAPYKPLPSNKKKKNNKKNNKKSECSGNNIDSSEEEMPHITPPTTPTQVFEFCLSIFPDCIKSDLEESCNSFFYHYDSINWKDIENWQSKAQWWMRKDIKDGKIKIIDTSRRL